MTTFLRLLNRSEESAYGRLQETCARNKVKVHIKVRVADVLPINGSGISNDLFSFALASHFDFVVADEAHYPLFAVEFDGPLHQTEAMQVERDRKKNSLCQRF